MRNFTFFITLLLVCISLLSNEAKSNNIMGSDMEINCLGDSTFEVNVDMYRDCQGISSFDGTLTFSSICGNVNVSIDDSALQNVSDVTPFCERICNACDSGGSNCLGFGMERYEYTTQVDLSGLMANGCCEFTVEGLDECCRNSAIDNVNLATGSTYRVENTFNPCNATGSCPSTPEVKNDPIAVICEGDQFEFDFGIEADSLDSVVYELADPLTTNGNPVDWNSPWNKYEPLTYMGMNSPFFNRHSTFPRGFHLDSLTGELKFTAEDIMSGLVSIEVRQYRNNQLVSSMQRDMQFKVIDCGNFTNNAPVSKLDSHYYEVCAGNNIAFPIDVADPDSTGSYPDSVFIDWDEGISGAQFTPDSGLVYATANFLWTPDNSDASPVPHSFIYNVRDNHCPVYDEMAGSVQIAVNESPEPDISTYVTSCGEVHFNASVDNESNPSFEWSGDEGLNSTKDSFSHQFSSPGKYAYELTVTGSDCQSVVYDTVEVPEYFSINAGSELHVCSNEQANISVTPQYAKGDISYNWNIEGSEDSAFSQDTTLIIEATDSTGCTAYDTLDIYVNPLPEVDISTSVSNCGEVQFDASVNNESDPSFEWSGDVGLHSTESSFSHNYLSPGAYPFTLTVSGAECQKVVYDTIKVPEFFTIDAGSDQDICYGEEAIISTQTQNAMGDIVYNWNFAGKEDSAFSYAFSQDTTLIVEATDPTGCSAFDTIDVNVKPLPEAHISTKVSSCGDIHFSASFENDNNEIIEWIGENGLYSSKDSFSHQYSSPGEYAYSLTVSGSDCQSVIYGTIDVPEFFSFDAGEDINICSGEMANISTTTENAIGEVSYDWNVAGLQGPGFSTTFYEDTTFFIKATDSTGCSAYDSIDINVQEFDWDFYLNNCNQLKAKAVSDPEGSLDFTWNTWDGSEIKSDSFSKELPEAGMYHFSLNIEGSGCNVQFEDSIYFPGLLDVKLSDTSVCEQDQVLIIPEVKNPAGIPSFNWSTGHDSSAIMFSAVSDSLISVTVSDTLGCPAKDTMLVQTVPKPTTPVITESNDSLYAGTSADYFIWTANGDTLHEGISPYFVPESDDSIKVTAVNSGLCSSTSEAYDFATFLRTPAKAEEEIEIYPNPAGRELNIETPVAAQKYQITDLSGRKILERSGTGTGSTIKKLDISNLEAGTYFIRIKMENGTYTRQWIKEE